MKMFLTGFMDYLRVERGLSSSSVASYQSDVRQFCDFLEDRVLTASEITAFSQDLFKRELTASSISRKLSSIKQFCQYLLIDNHIHTDMEGVIIKPKCPQKLPKVLPVDKIIELSEVAKDASSYPLRDSAIVELCYACGLRVSEISLISEEDIQNKSILKLCGKGGKERIVPIGTIAQKAVALYCQNERISLCNSYSHGRLFLGRSGRPLSRQRVYTIIKNAAQKVGGLEDMTPHMIRHSFATHLLDGQADLREVQSLLGHSNITTTQIYTHLAKKDLKVAYKEYHPRQ